jgi:aminopeptidase N
MADYLATATIGRFNLTSSPSTVGSSGSLPGVAYYLAIDPQVSSAASGPVSQTPDIVAWFSRVFGPYPFGVTGGVVDNAPSVGYSMETQTKPIYSRPPDVDTVAHELTHQWYGDSVTPTLWRDVWLNEGFATYGEWLWGERSGRQSAQSIFDAYYARPATDLIWQVPPADPGGAQNIFHPAVYVRGAMALQALRSVVSTRMLYLILQTWATEHRHGHGTTDEFVALAERLSGRKLGDLFQRWLYQQGKPAFP